MKEEPPAGRLAGRAKSAGAAKGRRDIKRLRRTPTTPSQPASSTSSTSRTASKSTSVGGGRESLGMTLRSRTRTMTTSTPGEPPCQETFATTTTATTAMITAITTTITATATTTAPATVAAATTTMAAAASSVVSNSVSISPSPAPPPTPPVSSSLVNIHVANANQSTLILPSPSSSPSLSSPPPSSSLLLHRSVSNMPQRIRFRRMVAVVESPSSSSSSSPSPSPSPPYSPVSMPAPSPALPPASFLSTIRSYRDDFVGGTTPQQVRASAEEVAAQLRQLRQLRQMRQARLDEAYGTAQQPALDAAYQRVNEASLLAALQRYRPDPGAGSRAHHGQRLRVSLSRMSLPPAVPARVAARPPEPVYYLHRAPRGERAEDGAALDISNYLSLINQAVAARQERMCVDPASHRTTLATGGRVAVTAAAAAVDVPRYVREREVAGYHAHTSQRTSLSEYQSHVVPTMLRRTEINLGTMDKVFASAWLNDSQIVFGTKSNELEVINIGTNQMARIPSLDSSVMNEPSSAGGIHALDVSPSRIFLATGASNVNDVAVYKLPTLDPVFVGERGHSDWLFDIKWLDDYSFLSGSRDSRLAVWKVSDDDTRPYKGACSSEYDTRPYKGMCSVEYDARPYKDVTRYRHETPLHVSQYENAEVFGGIRSLAYNQRRKEIGILTSQAYLRVLDIETFKLKDSQVLPFSIECVCLTIDPDCNLYAIGSKSFITLMDTRTVRAAHSFRVAPAFVGARSLAFNSHILSVGTGGGTLGFYDVRAKSYLFCDCKRPVMLICGDGYFRQDDNFRAMDDDGKRHAIYTHSYDVTRSRLFVAGGPLPANICGNYCAVWSI